MENTEAWAIKASLGADVSSNVSVSLDGAFANVEHHGAFDLQPGLGDFDTWIVAGTVHWKPVAGLTISAEVAYETVDHDNETGFFGGTGSQYGPNSDEDIWGVMMRINRTF